MDRFCWEYNVNIIGSKYCLNDLVRNIIRPENEYGYMKKIIDKEKIGKKYYISEEIFKDTLVHEEGSRPAKACKLLMNLETEFEKLEKEYKTTELEDPDKLYMGYKFKNNELINEYEFKVREFELIFQINKCEIEHRLQVGEIINESNTESKYCIKNGIEHENEFEYALKMQRCEIDYESNINKLKEEINTCRSDYEKKNLYK